MGDSDKSLYLLLQCLGWILCPQDKKAPPHLKCLLTHQTTLMHFVSACVCVCVSDCILVFLGVSVM